MYRLFLRTWIVVWLVILGGCVSERPRPYSGENSAQAVGVKTDDLRRIEDQFVALLIRSGCEIRPAVSRWWPLSPDLHHRIDLEFDAERRLVAGQNMPRKGPRMPWAPGTLETLDRCVLHAIQLGEKQTFVDAPADGGVSLFLPLVPIQR
jgi:hypothetical protein